MTNNLKSFIYGCVFVFFMCAINTIPLEVMLTNSTKIALGVSLVFLDCSHRFNQKIAVVSVFLGGLLSYFLSHPDFALPGVICYFFTYAMEMAIFHKLYYSRRLNFSSSMILSSLAPSLLNGVAWSYVIGSFDKTWANDAMIFFVFSCVLCFASIFFCKFRYIALSFLTTILGFFIAFRSDEAWIDPAAELWANHFLNFMGFGSVSLQVEEHLGFIAKIDWAVSAVYMLVIPVIFAWILAKKERLLSATR